MFKAILASLLLAISINAFSHAEAYKSTETTKVFEDPNLAIDLAKYFDIPEALQNRTTSVEEKIQLLVAENCYHKNLMHTALRNDQVEVIELVLSLDDSSLSKEKKKQLLVAKDYDDSNLIHIAAQKGHAKVINLILNLDNTILSVEEKK